MVKKYTTREEVEWLKSNSKGVSYKELAEKFNKKFNRNKTAIQISAICGRYKCRNGVDCTFKKGNIPPNKGTKGLFNIGGNKTSFKKGHKLNEKRPIGDEREDKDGYISIKVSGRKWKLKHRLIWEKHNGKIPKNHNVMFIDGNKRNFDINNLILISQQELLTLNRNHLLNKDSELNRVGIITAKLITKVNEFKNKK